MIRVIPAAGIAKTELVNGELIITYTDGTSDNLGSINSNVTDSVSMLNFTRLDDGTLSVAIKEEYKTVAENITIPSTFNGRTVSTISEKAFMDCKYLSNITIPKTVNAIEQRAFSGCSVLDNVVIPEGVKVINGFAFSQCSSLTNVVLPQSLTTIGDHCFYVCTALVEIILPDNLTTVGYSAFGDCYSLEKITIPSKMTKIGDYAFVDCKSLAKLNIPKSVTSIGRGIIASSNVESVYFENPNGWRRYSGVEREVPSSTFMDPKAAAKELNTRYDDKDSPVMPYYSYKRY